MSQEKFENHKKSLKSKKLQTPLTLAAQFSRYHYEISNQNYHFNRHQVEAMILRDVKKEDLVEFYEVSEGMKTLFYFQGVGNSSFFNF